MSHGADLIRASQWWNHKVPPLIAVAALTLLGDPSEGGASELVRFLLLLVSIVGFASFGHLVNDWADIASDEAAGVPNQMSQLGPWARVATVAVSLAVGLLPWTWLPRSPVVLALLGVQVGLLVAYSIPPMRLKDRAAAGVLADALYAYVVPAVLVVALFNDSRNADADGRAVTLSLIVWMVLMGVRGILWHQLADLAADRSAGLRTLATTLGAARCGRLLGRLVILEFAACTAFLLAVSSRIGPWPVFLWGAYLLYRAFQVSILWSEPLRVRILRSSAGRVEAIGFVLINEFVEKWLPAAALVALSLQNPAAWGILIPYLLLFDNAFLEVVRRDLPALPDGVNRLLHERRARRGIRSVEVTRRSLASSGPAALREDFRERHRWVFVVCGPAVHLATLRNAVRHLRPLTSLEIWVVTDPARNSVPLDASGVDHVVEVTTPPDLDDHQASIWLKTSVHRHVGGGEWCYLDSDIVAVAPGVEGVFEHRCGPVAFASDLTVATNCVDRFSPWAMTCSCAGQGDEHSCSHLREQLAARFGLDVPGDWVHWNGGVFLFGEHSHEVLDRWHETAVMSFDWPEWHTRDQGALIATAWSLGLQDLPRIPPEYNFIADLGNSDLCLDPERGWSLHPSGPWYQSRLLHLYTSRLEDPTWDLSRDLEGPVIRQTMVRAQRWRRFEIMNSARRPVQSAARRLRSRARRMVLTCRAYSDAVRDEPQRLRPSRIADSVRRRMRSGDARQPRSSA